MNWILLISIAVFGAVNAIDVVVNQEKPKTEAPPPAPKDEVEPNVNPDGSVIDGDRQPIYDMQTVSETEVPLNLDVQIKAVRMILENPDAELTIDETYLLAAIKKEMILSEEQKILIGKILEAQRLEEADAIFSQLVKTGEATPEERAISFALKEGEELTEAQEDAVEAKLREEMLKKAMVMLKEAEGEEYSALLRSVMVALETKESLSKEDKEALMSFMQKMAPNMETMAGVSELAYEILDETFDFEECMQAVQTHVENSLQPAVGSAMKEFKRLLGAFVGTDPRPSRAERVAMRRKLRSEIVQPTQKALRRYKSQSGRKCQMDCVAAENYCLNPPAEGTVRKAKAGAAPQKKRKRRAVARK